MHTMTVLRCGHCGKRYECRKAEVEYRRRVGIKANYCSLACAGLARRVNRTDAEKKTLKAAYDRQYRARNRARLRAKAAAYHKRTYNPEAAREARKERVRWHVEYCRRYYADPKRKAAKQEYDRDRRAAEYGEFAEAYKALLALREDILRRMPDKYERLKARGYYQMRTAQERKRNAQISSK